MPYAKTAYLYFQSSLASLFLFSFTFLIGKFDIKKVPSVVYFLFASFCFYCLQYDRGLSLYLGFNRSLVCTTLALALPFFYTKANLAMAFAACVASDTSMGIIAISFSFFVKQLVEKKYKTSLILVIIALVSFVTTHEGDAFRFSDRLHHWKFALSNWVELGNIWTGTYSGSFSFLMPAMQRVTTGQGTNLFAHLHNDYLQLFCESGIIGIVLAFYVLIDHVFILAKKRDSLLLMFVASYLVSCVGNFPSHLAQNVIFIIAFFNEFGGKYGSGKTRFNILHCGRARGCV
jgi:hypothetical protein